ncbi:MAG TPA: hypothetical protein VHA11_12990, partial [Bryobacteraceae bacterium]|nr:hypothetical protein [Bryobacteraceae bacterium]
PNERLLSLAPRGTSILEAFRMGQEFLRQSVQDIVEIVTTPGFINRDFSDIRSTLFGMGHAVLGTATARGASAAEEAARLAISCPLIEQSGIRGARNVLLNIAGSSALGLHEVNDACQLIRAATEYEDVQVNFGLVLNESMGDSVKVTVIATGFPQRALPAAIAAPVPAVESEAGWLSEAPALAAPATEAVVEPAPLVPAPAEELAPVVEAAPEPEPEPEDDLDDLDTPAYLRQRRVLR